MADPQAASLSIVVPTYNERDGLAGLVAAIFAAYAHEGVDGDCLAQASLFAALAELVNTYGEDAVAKFAEGLAARVRNGEFSLALARQ